MKQGLLLKEAPEPIMVVQCGFVNLDKKIVCNELFDTSYAYALHREKIHNQRLEYFLDEYDYQYGGKGEIYHAKDWSNKWVTPEESQGRMRKPWPAPSRPVRRYYITDQERANMSKKNTCFCGNSFKWPRRKYCSDTCANDWWMEKSAVWDIFKTRFLNKQNPKSYRYICEHCNEETKHPEVDHIRAIVLGGHPWDYRNLQVLCHQCHKIKTKSDVGILAAWRRLANYDTGPIIPDPQLTLDNIMELDYAFS